MRTVVHCDLAADVLKALELREVRSPLMSHARIASVYGSLHSMFRKLPPSWRTNLKKTFGADGHGQSTFDWLSARKDAAGKKRLDRALGGLVDTLSPEVASSLIGKICIDFGAGYVPTDGAAMWLLGAREVYGVDYNSIAKPKAIAKAVNEAPIDLIKDQLEALAIDDDWPARLDTLRRWAAKGDVGFPPGYTYLAPSDVIETPAVLPRFDVLVSTSVLEHIRPSLIVALFEAFATRSNDGAIQCHQVDLRDHRDFERNPYGFLDALSDFDAEAEADARGNGMTLDDWKQLLASYPTWGLHVSHFHIGRPELMPARPRTPAMPVVADSLIVRSKAN